MQRFSRFVALAGALALGSIAAAQAAPTSEDDHPTPRVELRLETAIDTRRTRTGDALAFTLVGGDCVDGRRLRGGASITGRVVHAQKAGMFGKAGELLIAADPWTPDGASAPVRFRDLRAIAGRHRDGAAIGVAVVVGPFAAFVRGGNVVIPAGTPMDAGIRDASHAPESAFEPCAAAEAQAPPVTPPVPEEPLQGELHEAHDVRPVDPGREPALEPGDGADAAGPGDARDRDGR